MNLTPADKALAESFAQASAGVEMSAKHTPTPWRVVDDERTYNNGYMDLIEVVGFDIVAPDDTQIVGSEGIDGGDVGAANADRIVLCVNNHDSLVAALTELLKRAERDICDPEDVPEIDFARAALSKLGSPT